MSQGPSTRATLRGFSALVLDMARIDADRRPSPEMIKWHRRLAATVGVEPAFTPTNRAMLRECRRLRRIVDEASRAQTDAGAAGGGADILGA